ncbi:hypothetical protein L6452_20541 [Arctium lappa]|uniref:Uncharacterized protein n=1 Tax=Arctium lappa TaxID=4217 RepID=A0ACB9BAT8_ARCLA|nr:hypothetical protein L6452_20541 [Arctium lappa]
MNDLFWMNTMILLSPVRVVARVATFSLNPSHRFPISLESAICGFIAATGYVGVSHRQLFAMIDAGTGHRRLLLLLILVSSIEKWL